MPSDKGPSISALGIFLVSAAFFTKHRRRKPRNDFPEYADENVSAAVERGVIGSRGSAALKPALSYWNSFFLCLQNPCDPVTNPEGYIALCVAENKLVQEIFATRLMQPGTAYSAFSDSMVYCYNGFLGLPPARQAVAYFFARRFLHADDGGLSSTSQFTDLNAAPEDSAQRINADHIVLGAGVGSLLSHVFFALTERTDAVLIPAPYYASFEYDMQAIAGCVPQAVHMKNPSHGPSLEELLMGAYQAEKQGLRVKALLLTNPNDPLGVIYSPSVVRNAVTWARSRRMHVIVDEIYALSIHKKERSGFQSIMKILDNKLGDDVHMLWGLSKDFGASGFRVGVLYTQNKVLLQALANLNRFSGVSHPMQQITAEILTDDSFVDSFLDSARAQLTWSYTACTRKLEEMVIPFVPAEAGISVYVDFSSLLPTQTFESEEKFASLVEHHARVVMTPGQCMRDRKPGMFRICYAWVSPDVLEIAMERLSYLITKVRRYDWDNLDSSTLSDVVKRDSRSIRRNASINLSELTSSKF